MWKVQSTLISFNIYYNQQQTNERCFKITNPFLIPESITLNEFSKNNNLAQIMHSIMQKIFRAISKESKKLRLRIKGLRIFSEKLPCQFWDLIIYYLHEKQDNVTSRLFQTSKNDLTKKQCIT